MIPTGGVLFDCSDDRPGKTSPRKPLLEQKNLIVQYEQEMWTKMGSSLGRTLNLLFSATRILAVLVEKSCNAHRNAS